MSATDLNAAKERDEVRRRLNALLRQTPSGHSTWSFQQAVAFKDAVVKARRALNAPKVTLHQLRDAEAILRQFHSEA